MKNKFILGVCCALTISLCASITPIANAAEASPETKTFSCVDVNHPERCAGFNLDENTVTINGVTYTAEEFSERLKDAYQIKDRFAAVAAAPAAYFIPGVGEILITATGTIIVGGAAIYAGSWLYGVITNWFKEHTSNKRKSTHDKHAKPRPGRANEKKKCKPGWKCHK